MPFYFITLFFLLFSAVFARSPTCRRRHRVSPSNNNPLDSPIIISIDLSTQFFTTITIPTPIISFSVPQATSSSELSSSHSVPQATPSSEPGGSSNPDIQTYLNAHNTVRKKHGAVPLTWSDNLASKAQQWANNCVFEHSGGTLGDFGENIAAGSGSFDISNAVGAWAAEAAQYDPNDPIPSHFTQLVWKATTQLGCAVQTCNGIFSSADGPAQFHVCEYYVQGNVLGYIAENVQV